jgi:uncharacterized protein (TIGR02271 family)
MELPTLDKPRPANVRPVEASAGAPRTTERPTQAAESSAPGGPIEITCREERLDVTTEWHSIGTARLRKYVTTEAVERRVPVVRERVRVERVPVTEAERAALSDEEVAEAMEEVTLREERPVVRKYLAPIERVRLVVERFTDEAVIRDELRREQVEIHDSTAEPPHGTPGMNPPSTPPGNPPASGRPEPLRPS